LKSFQSVVQRCNEADERFAEARFARDYLIRSQLIAGVEAVEKVPKQILGRDAEKSDLTECTTINDLMLGKGQETYANYSLITLRGFFYRLVMLLRRITMSFPIRHESHTLEQKSETFFRNQIPQDWVANRPQNDYGVDFQIGITEGRELRGLELVVQLKASERSSGDEDTETITLRVSTYNYLRELLTVVMLVKYVESEGEAYWVFLREITPPMDEGQKTFTVHIPKANRLSATNWEAITTVVRQITNLKLGAVNG